MLDLIESRIAGLRASLQELRGQKELFDKARGIDEESARVRAEVQEKEDALSRVKSEIASCKAEKTEAVKPTLEALSKQMSLLLPLGEAIFEIGDSGLFIGWRRPDGTRVPYGGLSGGQRVPFDQALSYALLGPGSKTIIMEAAEVDETNLQALLWHLLATPEDTQILLSTYLRPSEIPTEWTVVEVA